MQALKGNLVFLRALEPEDLEFLYYLENDSSIWEISGTQKPYSKAILKKYLANTHLDIYEIKQLRLSICTNSNQMIGLIDLFDFDPKHRRAGVGLVIADEENRGKGYGLEALALLSEYCFKHLDLHQLYANILEENTRSISLFKKAGFKMVGVKNEWILSEGVFKNEILYQKINSEQS
ncbi:acetyltransferase [Croceivirga lutea]|uniref:GNAT family N-acetyltransferase n=1 Tax=Croceivirga lutea TaxID=1775167 RepID=UPI00163A28BD|nr:GNAT family N-acetyltransferase [Croceivirga lutea]GGG47080.1 acetyltransferase [Croceivirga lutea]